MTTRLAAARVVLTGWLTLTVAAFAVSAEKPGPGRPLPDEVYKDYKPPWPHDNWPTELMKTSLQTTYYNRSSVTEEVQCKAWVREGIKCETAGDYPEAIRCYQAVIEKYPECLIPAGEYGAFVSAPLYVQYRILAFPPKHLDYYRLQYDAPAREIFHRALERYDVFELHHVAEFHLATTWGTRALYELGRRAMDAGYYEEAVRYFERIHRWHRPADVDSFQVKFLRAYASRLLGHEAQVQSLRKELQSAPDRKPDEIAQRLAVLDALKPRPRAGTEFIQRANPKYMSFGDYAACAPMTDTLYTLECRWRAKLPTAPLPTVDDRASGGELRPFHMPWVVGNSLYYKHHNRVYCRSLVNGQLRWAFELGALDRDVGRNIRTDHEGRRQCTVWQTEQSILVDEHLIFATVGAYGANESLVALDRVTGQMQWVAGALQPQDDTDLALRYDATPGLGRQAVYAPWSYQQGDGRNHIYTTAGLTAFDKETGRVLWRKELARLVPTATTQERYGIRVYAAPPLVHDGVIYWCTNAGIMAALDADSGSVRGSSAIRTFGGGASGR